MFIDAKLYVYVHMPMDTNYVRMFLEKKYKVQFNRYFN